MVQLIFQKDLLRHVKINSLTFLHLLKLASKQDRFAPFNSPEPWLENTEIDLDKAIIYGNQLFVEVRQVPNKFELQTVIN